MTKRAGVHDKGTFSLSEAITNAKESEGFCRAGAIALFIGVVRGETLEEQKEEVQKLTLEAYEEKANEALEQICDDLSKKNGIVDVQIHHLLGEFKVGEDLLYVSVAGSHRTDVFPVLQEAVERYKKEAPVFKKEQTIDSKGSTTQYWVSEKETHHQ